MPSIQTIQACDTKEKISQRFSETELKKILKENKWPYKGDKARLVDRVYSYFIRMFNSPSNPSQSTRPKVLEVPGCPCCPMSFRNVKSIRRFLEFTCKFVSTFPAHHSPKWYLMLLFLTLFDFWMPTSFHPGKLRFRAGNCIDWLGGAARLLFLRVTLICFFPFFDSNFSK
jgi:hypothetical protein